MIIVLYFIYISSKNAIEGFNTDTKDALRSPNGEKWIFDGSDDWYTIPNPGYKTYMEKMGFTKYTQDFSISFLLKIENTHNNWRNIFHFTNTGNDVDRGGRVPAVWVVPGQTKLHVRFTTDRGGNDGINDTAPLPLNTPMLCTFVFNGGSVLFYINKELKSRDQFSNIQVRNPKTILYIGDPFYSQNGGVKIKNFTVYNRDITPGEINQIYDLITMGL